jgi:hypothetical protein
MTIFIVFPPDSLDWPSIPGGGNPLTESLFSSPRSLRDGGTGEKGSSFHLSRAGRD